jgi:hypothetical protein
MAAVMRLNGDAKGGERWSHAVSQSRLGQTVNDGEGKGSRSGHERGGASGSVASSQLGSFVSPSSLSPIPPSSSHWAGAPNSAPRSQLAATV